MNNGKSNSLLIKCQGIRAYQIIEIERERDEGMEGEIVLLRKNEEIFPPVECSSGSSEE